MFNPTAINGRVVELRTAVDPLRLSGIGGGIEGRRRMNVLASTEVISDVIEMFTVVTF